MPKIGLLASNQANDAKPRTFIPRETAVELARRLCAERISAKVYRLFPHNTIFQTLKPQHTSARPFIPPTLPPLEVGGLVYDGPRPPTIHETISDFLLRT